MTDYQETEELVKQSFKAGEKFSYENQEYIIELSGKPRPTKGECKTDLYVLAKNNDEEKKEFKFSIKKDNYEFLENKISSETAEEIFGPDFKKIISDLSTKLSTKFNELKKVKYDDKKKVKSLIMGWKLELFKNTRGTLSTDLELEIDQLRPILTGEGRSLDKIDCSVNGEIIKNSGVANLMMVLPGDSQTLSKKNIEYFLSKVKTIDNYLGEITINARFTALTFFTSKTGIGKLLGKWDGDRPLAVWIDWSLKEDKLESEVIINKPFKSANEIGNNLRNLLFPDKEP